ncbi:SDR family oxidoreductase [Mucilaginibacter pedocola]|uniref:Nucleoside-diphosphate sugar epimerase n=1 Tax=Mucilaginibacter pedocola TaxID=1792845 RepID=A0A1S9PL54_9SPHI|nr:aldehyde reductase [Mucilaginibacter pedocola]OOQ61693.1 nucleoside-diphosphate sugar epimerase [Mucilaginibacter pedocola]
MKKRVLLTGISGFLGSHTAIQLLNKGYEVVGTLRDQKRAEAIKNVIAKHTEHTANLSFAQAELSDEKVWAKLCEDIDYVQHIASPFPRETPKHEDELIIPAKNGVLFILKAASAAGVKRVVLTSSSSAVLYGKPAGQESGTHDETVWTDATNKADTTPYFRSKTIAEKAAWDFIKANKSGMELVTVLPGAILGPVLEDDFGTSANIVLKMMDGSMPAIPNIGFDVVDVRSVADSLILAMEKPEAAGERFISSAGFLSFPEVSAILRSKYPGRKIPKSILPNFLTRILAWFDKALGPVLLDLGKQRRANSSKARRLLGWQPIDNREAVISCAESLIALGLLK